MVPEAPMALVRKAYPSRMPPSRRRPGALAPRPRRGWWTFWRARV